jgi:V/A-type H+-transporting ATPase subunit K
MEAFLAILGWVGIYAPVALSAIGAVIGCSTGGQAAIGAMLDVESGYGRFVGVAALPSSQTIYGIVIMLTLNRTVTPENAPALFAIGVLSGAALWVAAVWQGACCASAITAIKEKPEVFGLSIAPAALVEGFAVFAFVFALVLAGTLPGS